MALCAVTTFLLTLTPSRADEPDTRRTTVANRLLSSLNWTNSLGAYEVEVASKEWAGSERKEDLSHELWRVHVAQNATTKVAFEVWANAYEIAEIGKDNKGVGSLAGFRMINGNNYISGPSSTNSGDLETLLEFSEFQNKATFPLQFLPTCYLFENSRDSPLKLIDKSISCIMNERWRLSSSPSQIHVGNEVVMTYRLEARASKSFTMIEITMDETDAERPLLRRFRTVLSKPGRLRYENEQDIAAIQFDIQTEYKLIGDAKVKVPVQVSTLRNSIGVGNGLKTLASRRVVSVLSWKFPESVELPDREDLRILAEEHRTVLEKYVE